MAYLATERARQRRADPRLILPECRSILVLAATYPANTTLKDKYISSSKLVELRSTNFEEQDSIINEGWRGKVASYAWGEDYHHVLPRAMEKLVEFIQAQIDRPLAYRCYTDSGPLLERELAQRAGLGWIGKNSLLIHPDLGSYFFLAEILLDLDLPPDPPFEHDRCGTCRRCIEACPTSCILPDRTLDARRCISYLTIELKGTIPLDLRDKMGEWVFGCDICQQACPWNWDLRGRAGGEAAGTFPGLEARPQVAKPKLADELLLTAQEFNHKFKGSPVRRAKRRGYLRNVAVALGNRLRSSTSPLDGEVDALKQALETDPEALVREHAAWALKELIP